MNKQSAGIHHITAIVGNPQENVDFYAGVLGLRLVKKTVNFDDPNTYHFYFGDEKGSPGTIITFFPWIGAFPGKIGDGQVGITSYAIPKGALSFWEKRFEKFNIQTEKFERFGETVLQFSDVHGLQLELVEREEGPLNDWRFDDITPEVAIKGFAGATLYSSFPDLTMDLLENVMGFEKIASDNEYVRFRSTSSIGNTVDVKKVSVGQGRMGVGTVHHIAWRATDDADQLEWQEYVASKGFHVTAVQDRNYFNAIYFRERGGILFEIATDPPGFAHDESLETMGEKLMLPAQYEQYREKLEQHLPPIEVRTIEKLERK